MRCVLKCVNKYKMLFLRFIRTSASVLFEDGLRVIKAVGRREEDPFHRASVHECATSKKYSEEGSHYHRQRFA